MGMTYGAFQVCSFGLSVVNKSGFQHLFKPSEHSSRVEKMLESGLECLLTTTAHIHFPDCTATTFPPNRDSKGTKGVPQPALDGKRMLQGEAEFDSKIHTN
jgi:hypothetical protein